PDVLPAKRADLRHRGGDAGMYPHAHGGEIAPADEHDSTQHRRDPPNGFAPIDALNLFCCRHSRGPRLEITTLQLADGEIRRAGRERHVRERWIRTGR